MMGNRQEKSPNITTWLVGLLALLWLAGITIAYYLFHKPFSPEQALALAIFAWRLAAAGLILSAAGGLGRRIFPALQVHPMARMVLQGAVGLGILALAALLVGSLGGFNRLVAGGGLAIMLLGLRRQAMGWWREVSAWRELWQPVGGVGRALAACFAGIAFCTLLIAAVSPVKFDALVYHLALPQIYLLVGRFHYVPQIMFWGMPQNGEMLYTWAMLLGGVSAAPLLGWCFGMLAVLGLAGYLLDQLGVEAAWVGVAALLCGFSLASALGWGYVDWLVMLFAVAFLISLDAWQRDGALRWLLLSGACLGLAMGTKYTAGVLLPGVVVVLLAQKRSASLRQRLVWAASITLAAGLTFLPWLLKNLVLTGNPFYPLLFPAGAMTRLRLETYQGIQAWGNWLDFIFLPLRATLVGLEGSPGYSASIGALMLGLGGLAWINWRSATGAYRQFVSQSTLLVLPGLLAWMILGRFSGYLLQARLYFALFPALAALAAAGYSSLAGLVLPGVRLGRVAGALVILVFALTSFEIGVEMLRKDALRASLGLVTRQDYLEANLGWYIRAMQAVQGLPPGSKTVMLWETRSLYCLPVCEPDEIIDRWLSERYAASGDHRDGVFPPLPARTPAEILNGWREAGYTHLLFYRSGADFVRSQNNVYDYYLLPDWQAQEELLERLPVVQDFGGVYRLYSLQP